MRLWRISNYADLLGIGGLVTAGRWDHRGLPVVYLAEHPALALLEVMVHFELARDELPLNFQLLEVQIPEAPEADAPWWQPLDAAQLPEDWPDQPETSRQLGDAWLQSLASPLLRVPSVIAPASFNYLLNPRHPLAGACEILAIHRHPWDARLRRG